MISSTTKPQWRRSIAAVVISWVVVCANVANMAMPAAASWACECNYRSPCREYVTDHGAQFVQEINPSECYSCRGTDQPADLNRSHYDVGAAATHECLPETFDCAAGYEPGPDGNFTAACWCNTGHPCWSTAHCLDRGGATCVGDELSPLTHYYGCWNYVGGSCVPTDPAAHGPKHFNQWLHDSVDDFTDLYAAPYVLRMWNTLPVNILSKFCEPVIKVVKKFFFVDGKGPHLVSIVAVLAGDYNGWNGWTSARTDLGWTPLFGQLALVWRVTFWHLLQSAVILTLCLAYYDFVGSNEDGDASSIHDPTQHILILLAIREGMYVIHLILCLCFVPSMFIVNLTAQLSKPYPDDAAEGSEHSRCTKIKLLFRQVFRKATFVWAAENVLFFLAPDLFLAGWSTAWRVGSPRVGCRRFTSSIVAVSQTATVSLTFILGIMSAHAIRHGVGPYDVYCCQSNATAFSGGPPRGQVCSESRMDLSAMADNNALCDITTSTVQMKGLPKALYAEFWLTLLRLGVLPYYLFLLTSSCWQRRRSSQRNHGEEGEPLQS